MRLTTIALLLTLGMAGALAGAEPPAEPPAERPAELPQTIAPDAVFALGGPRPETFNRTEPVRLASDAPIPRWFDGTVGLAYPDTSGGALVWRFVQAEEVAPEVLFPEVARADSLAEVVAAIEAAADSIRAANVAVGAERDSLAERVALLEADRSGALALLRALLDRLVHP